VESAVCDLDWRRFEAYAAVDDLAPSALAWEFLRRNPRYREDYRSFLDDAAFGAAAVAEGSRFARWGLTFAADPALSAREQPVFWRPEVYAQTIVLAPAPVRGLNTIPFAPDRWRGRWLEREADDGRHAVLDTPDGAHHLWMPTPIADGAPVVCVAPLSADALQSTAAILRFWRVLMGAPSSAPTSRSDVRLKRIRLSLKVLDALEEGISYRVLAERLFGAQRVAAESWRTSSVRDTTIRLARAGRLFTEDRYRRLLGYRSEG
jgi:hypothetical protein